MSDPKKYIRQNIPMKALLDTIAEEAVELAHAALKLKRTLPGSMNPTPVTHEEAMSKLVEEYADLMVVLDVAFPELDGKSHSVYLSKLLRWIDRVRESKQKEEPKQVPEKFPKQGIHSHSCLNYHSDCICLSCRRDGPNYVCCSEHCRECDSDSPCGEYLEDEHD